MRLHNYSYTSSNQEVTFGSSSITPREVIYIGAVPKATHSPTLPGLFVVLCAQSVYVCTYVELARLVYELSGYACAFTYEQRERDREREGEREREREREIERERSIDIERFEWAQ